jgi:hypothetical protein
MKSIVPTQSIFFYLDLFSIFITSYDISKYIQRSWSRLNSMARGAFYGRFLHAIDEASLIFTVFSCRIPVSVMLKHTMLVGSRFL